MKWEYNRDPHAPDGEDPYSARGWYAVLICYDSDEGSFPGAARWEGDEWSRRGVIAFGGRCETQERAEALAIENDPDFQK